MPSTTTSTRSPSSRHCSAVCSTHTWASTPYSATVSMCSRERCSPTAGSIEKRVLLTTTLARMPGTVRPKARGCCSVASTGICRSAAALLRRTAVATTAAKGTMCAANTVWMSQLRKHVLAGCSTDILIGNSKYTR